MLKTQLRTSFMRWLSGGGLRPVVVVALLATLFVAFPDRNFSLNDAVAAPSSSPACASGVGVGALNSGTFLETRGGHGCVVIKYVSGGVAQFETFNYTGADQTWTVPSGVTSAVFFLLGAGGGGVPYAGGYGDGGGAGYATGTYAVTPDQILTIIVGQGGGGELLTLRSGGEPNGCHTGSLTYGGGGRGGSCWSGYSYNYTASSGGGRSAIRLANATEIVTAAGGGGGGWQSNGGAGGGTSGTASSDAGGGTQSAGGTVTNALATIGSAYLGGNGYHQSGGGGGGYYGGGGGYSISGGGGGSSYVALLTSGSTTAGSGVNPGGAINSLATAGGVPSRPTVQNSCSQSGQNLTYSISQTSAGASAITNYEYHLATTRPASDPTSWTAFNPAQTGSSLTWDMRALGFTSGTVYKHYVRAVNSYGTSESSWNNSDPTATCSASFSAAAPGAPTSLTATAGSGSAEISFTAGAANGAAISNYEYSLNGTTYTALSPADASSPITIPGLTGGTSYTIYLKARNSAGLSSASSAVTVTPLAAAPTVSSVSSSSGTSAGGTAITITGTNFLSGATVTVGGAACTSVTVVSATSITCTTPAGTAGAQNVVVTNTDTQAATLSGGFTYIAPPSAPATPAVATASDSGSSNSDGVTSDNTPTISVASATNGNTVTVTATKVGSANVTCTFTATAQTSCDLGTLADGTWSVTSTQTSSGITSAASSALSMTIDTTRPTVSSFSSTKADGTYGLGTTINITATMSETVADGASITVTLDTGDTVVLTKATGTTLTGTYTVGVGDSSSDLTVSSYVLTSAPTDTAGNVMTSTTVPSGVNNIAGAHAIAISTTPPAVGSVSSSSGTVSGGTAITISGTGFASGATVTIGGSACTSVVVVSSTSITCTTPAGTTGAKDVVVTNSDTQASTLTGGFTYLPAAPGTPDIDAGSDSGSSNSDNITSDNTPTISVGSATNGNTVTVTASKVGSTSVTCTFTATAQTSCDLGTLADGTWSITSKQTSAGVDSAISAAVSVTIDTTRPTVTNFSTTTANGNYGVGGTINITATVSEDVAVGASITVTLDTGDTVVLTRATSTTLTGTYTVGVGDSSSDLTVSSYVLTSAPTDTAGNVMTSTSVPSGVNNIAGAHAIAIDTAAATLVSAAANSAGGQVTITMSEALHATTAAAADFAVSVGGVVVNVSTVTVSGSTVVLGLASNVAVGATISIIYTAPSSNSATSNSAIQDSVGNDAAGFTTTAVVPAGTTTTTAPAPSGGGGGSPASATTTTTTTTTTTAAPTTTTVAPVPVTTSTTTALRRTTTTTASLRSSSTSTSTSTPSTTSAVVRNTTTTVFRPLVPLAPVTTLLTSTTTVAPLRFPPKDLKNDLLVTASVAETRLAAALQNQAGSIEEVKSATLDLAKIKLELLDPKSAIVVAIKSAENRVTNLEKSGASTAQLQAAETRVEELLMVLAEMKSISVEKILETKANLDAVLGDTRATSVEVAAAKAEFTDARTPSFEEVKVSVGEGSSAEPSPVIINGVVDAPGGNQVVVFDGMRQLNLTVTRVNQTSIQMQSNDGFKLAIAAVDRNGVPFQLNSRGAVIVKHGNFIAVSGEGLAPNTIATTWLFSSPRVLGDLNVDGEGRFFAEFRVEEDVRIGDHVAQVNGVSKDGAKRSVNIDVEILPNLGPPPYDPLSEPRNVVDLTASALVLLAAMGASAARRREREEEQDEDRGSADVADVTVKFGSSKVDVGVDRIKPPRIKLVDDLFFNAPRWTTQVSPMLARVIADANYLRSLLGAIWFIAPIFGIVAGIAAAIDTSSDVVMPSLAICLVLMIIGVFDATAGFVAFGTFAIVVAFGGGISSSDSIRGLLGLAVFMFAVPLAASAMRPFRRLDKDNDDIWNRAVDVVLIALFGAWAAGAMFSALPALTGFKPEYSDEVNAVRFVALIALVVRWLLENAARVATPIRLSEIENDDLPMPSNIQQVISMIIRSFVFVFVAVVFIGNNWALWLGWVLYLAPKLVGLGADKLPDMRTVHRYLPRGIFKVVLMLFVAKWWGGLVAAQVDDPADMIKFGFVLLGLPGLAFGAVGWFARSSRPWPSTIVTKLLGTALLIIGVLVVLNIWLVI